jgi:hypothetical protein
MVKVCNDYFMIDALAGGQVVRKRKYRRENTMIGGRTGSSDNMTGGIIDEMRISNIPRYTTNFTPPSQPFIID